MRRRAAAIVGVVAPLFLARAWASGSCPVTLAPPDAPGWAGAVASAKSQLAAQSSDCGSVEIVVRPQGGAVLTFTTTEGRRATRTLMTPAELGPALAALLVDVPAPAASAAPSMSAVPSSSALPPSPSTSSAPPPPAVPAPVASAPEVHFRFAISAGTRLGFSGPYASPTFGLRPSGSFGAWELAVAVEYDPSYAYLPSALPGVSLWSVLYGVQIGRRETWRSVAIGYGVGLGAASIRETVDDSDGLRKVVDFAQPRGSAYVRAIVPAHATLRAVFELGFDVALNKLRKRETQRNDVPDLPRWGIFTSVGMETSAL